MNMYKTLLKPFAVVRNEFFFIFAAYVGFHLKENTLFVKSAEVLYCCLL